MTRRKGQGRPAPTPAPRAGGPWQDLPTLALRLWPAPEGLCAEVYVTRHPRQGQLSKEVLAYVVWRPQEVSVPMLLRWGARLLEAVERGDYRARGIASKE